MTALSTEVASSLIETLRNTTSNEPWSEAATCVAAVSPFAELPEPLLGCTGGQPVAPALAPPPAPFSASASAASVLAVSASVSALSVVNSFGAVFRVSPAGLLPACATALLVVGRAPSIAGVRYAFLKWPQQQASASASTAFASNSALAVVVCSGTRPASEPPSGPFPSVAAALFDALHVVAAAKVVHGAICPAAVVAESSVPGSAPLLSAFFCARVMGSKVRL
jgi:hypothetical protein